MKRSRPVWVVVSTLLVASPSLAQDGRQLEAKQKFEEGQRAYDLGQFESAMRSYAEAYQLLPLPAFLFNIGQCHRQLREWGRAAFYFRRFAAKIADGPEADRITHLIRDMEELEEEARRQPPPPPVPARVAVRRAPGTTKVVAEAPPKAEPPPAAEPAPVAPVAVEPTLPAVLEPAPAAPALIVATPSSEPESPSRRWWPWAAGAGGAVLTAVAIGVAVGVASTAQPQSPGYGTLDAR